MLLRLINGIIEYDEKQKIQLPAALLVHQRLLSKQFWVQILTSLFIYFLGFEVYRMYAWPPHSITTVVILIFGVPYILDFIVVISTCFYLINLECRFQILNDYWKDLHLILNSISSNSSISEIVMLMENIRLLHAEISQLLKKFSLGYGPLLLGYFVCSFIDMVYLLHLMISHEFNSKASITEILITYTPVHVFNIQLILFMMSIIVAASRINEKVIIIILLKLQVN